MDEYNKKLERAAIGRNNASRNVTPNEFTEIVDDTNARNIAEKYGEAAGKGYRLGTMMADIALGKSVLQKNLTTVKNVRTTVNAIDGLNELYQDSGANSVWEFAKETSDKIKSIEVGSREWFAEKHEEIEKQTSKYMKDGLSEQTARWKATKELIKEAFN